MSKQSKPWTIKDILWFAVAMALLGLVANIMMGLYPYG